MAFDDFRGRRVLQQEAAGAGPQRAEDVLVGVERGQHDDLGRPGRLPRAGRVAAIPSIFGIRRSISTTSGRCVATAASTWSPSAGLARRSIRLAAPSSIIDKPGPDEGVVVDEQHADRVVGPGRSVIRSRPRQVPACRGRTLRPRQPACSRNSPPPRGPAQLAAGQLTRSVSPIRPVPVPWQRGGGEDRRQPVDGCDTSTAPVPPGRRRASTADRLARRVLAGVGQPLLHHPVGGPPGASARQHLRVQASPLGVDRMPAARGFLDQRRQVGELGCGAAPPRVGRRRRAARRSRPAAPPAPGGRRLADHPGGAGELLGRRVRPVFERPGVGAAARAGGRARRASPARSERARPRAPRRPGGPGRPRRAPRARAARRSAPARARESRPSRPERRRRRRRAPATSRRRCG